jgi:integrase
VSLYRRNSTWWSSIFIEGVRHCQSTGTSNRRKAETIERQFRDELNDARHRVPHVNPDITFGDLVARFIANGMSTPYSLDRLNHLLPFFADIPIRDISTATVRRYRQQRHEEKKTLKVATVNRDLSVLRRVLNWGVEERLLAANPLGRLRMERERRTKRPVMSLREEFLLMAQSPAHLQRIIRCALDTGMRRGEVTAQRWEDIDFDNRILHVTHSKTPEGEARDIPLTGRLHDLLLAFRRDRGVVFTYEGSQIKIVKTTWASSLRRAGIRHFRFHDLRHTANTRMMLAGVLQEVRREILGHTSRHSRDVNDRYVQIELPEKQEAMRKLEVWLAAQTTLLEAQANEPSDSTATAEPVEPPAPHAAPGSATFDNQTHAHKEAS